VQCLGTLTSSASWCRRSDLVRAGHDQTFDKEAPGAISPICAMRANLFEWLPSPRDGYTKWLTYTVIFRGR
jgi:hypothetical protein